MNSTVGINPLPGLVLVNDFLGGVGVMLFHLSVFEVVNLHSVEVSHLRCTHLCKIVHHSAVRKVFLLVAVGEIHTNVVLRKENERGKANMRKRQGGKDNEKRSEGGVKGKAKFKFKIS